jgi:transposase-like protein
MKKITKQKQMTLAELDAKFPTESHCKAYLQARRWPTAVSCPRCANEKVYELTREYHWQCENCQKNGYRFSVLVGTIFENSNVDLKVWFKVIYLMLVSKKGISALQVQRMMGLGSYRTAWSMCHRIRVAMGNTEFLKLVGFVEVDETFVGGKARNKHKGPGGRGGMGGRGTMGKAIVAGALSRKGNIIARVVANTSAAVLDAFVRETVSTKVSLISTDEAAAYRDLGKTFPHGIVRHTRDEYVVGAVHTNSIEGFWSMVKRGIVGTFHKVTPKYLPLYVNEFQFRHNNRGNIDIFGSAIRAC